VRVHSAPAIVETGVCKSFGEAVVLDHADISVVEAIPDELERPILDSHIWLPFATRDALIPTATI